MTYKKFDTINMIPLIDIMLVLLVIVLTTATFISQGVIKVDLPKTKSGENSQKKESSKEIVIKSNGKIFFEKKEISIENLENIIKVYEKNVIFVIKSDKNAKFDDFVQVVDVLKSQNRSKIAITAINE